ncbi:MRC1-like domain-containing protein [Colletotrichum plurivorum]|uniref:MRC1-like domain-containing protein n=1 Tax=Colletotrichum plurivorum TaxID=2175906 RepID=A0A8H6NIQ2_9PEZI|nr:MRC1-like domain-containing protein [Colletotrichum plurivorum]
MASEQAAARSPSARPVPESLQARIEARLAAVDSDSEEEEVIRRPRGRLAAQMQGGSPREDSEEPESFLDRIQKRLEAADEDDATAEDTTMADAQEDEDDFPVAPRRLQRKQARETTPKPQSPAAAAPSSPGLFVSPNRDEPDAPFNETAADDASDSDASLPSLKNNSRFQALVERKRQERLAREAEEEKKKAERIERQKAMNADLFDDDGANVSDITDDEGGRKLSQAVRPARKAGKKAIEEMNRETQRMARNMQLAHEAKTRKKFSKADFLERFNFRKAEPKSDPKTQSSSRPATPVSAHQTDAEMKDPETPPSSPPVTKTMTPSKDQQTTTTVAPPAAHSDDEEELPSLDDVFEASKKLDKGKGKGKAIASPEKAPVKEAKPKRQVRIKLPSITAHHAVIDLDDDLEITGVKNSKLDAIFKNVPTKKCNEPRSMFALRQLAHITSPGKQRKKRDEKSTMTAGELHFTLQQRAREQAKMEREKRLEYLRSKGIVVQTAEEREREMQEVEDIVARARREAEEIMERERELAKEEKKEKRKNGELDAWDDSDDEEYEGSDEEVAADAEVELSGSEEEDEEGVSDEEPEGNALLDNEANDSGSEQSEAEADAPEKDPFIDSEDDFDLPKKNIRRAKKIQVISDDEDEEESRVEATPRPKTANQQSPAAPNTKSPAIPTTVLRSAKKTFIPGLPVTGAAGLGLTQIFAGTMDDSQPAAGTIPSQSSMPDFDSLPDSNLIGNSQQDSMMILDSQGGDTQRAETQPDSADGVHLHFTQSQVHGFDSLIRDEPPCTQMSIEATQDAGPQDYTPLKSRFVEPPVSTVETMVLDGDAEAETVLESPLVRRGRLRRKIDAAPAPAVEDEDESRPASPDVDEFGFNTTAFSVMRDAAKEQKRRRKAEEYNRKKSKAKDMVEDQAEESEDEYAGLGGADGEDSDDDDAASVKEMIDDQGGLTADEERKLAALHAERERATDEKMVDKLFHDITTGMLRRKRGADYDLSDSDDGGEARRRMKRRQFQKMQQALFADERIKKIAEKPGNQAFLRTLEDRGSDDEMDFLDLAPPPEPMQTDGGDASQSQTVPDSQPAAHNQRQPLAPANRSAADSRRRRDGKKPSNIGEIRESVSSLLEDLDVEIVPATDPASDSEAEDGHERGRTPGGDKENRSPPAGRNPRRTTATRPEVIDRISLKRAGSSSSSMAATSSRLAFAMPTTAAGGSFRVPNLLRRATTNSSSFKSSSGGSGVQYSSGGSSAGAGAGGSGGGFGDDGKIKKNASKRSGVSALARENERRAAVQENEKRREARKWKGAESRVKAVGGLFGAGKFE